MNVTYVLLLNTVESIMYMCNVCSVKCVSHIMSQNVIYKLTEKLQIYWSFKYEIPSRWNGLWTFYVRLLTQCSKYQHLHACRETEL
jgi:hypothetical protein